jgi:hypothetical protein
VVGNHHHYHHHSEAFSCLPRRRRTALFSYLFSLRQSTTTLVSSSSSSLDTETTATACVDAAAVPTAKGEQADDILLSLFGSRQVRDEFLHEWIPDDSHVFHGYIPRRTATTTTSDTSHPSPPLSGIDLASLYETSHFISLRIRGSHDLLDKNTTSYHDLCQYIAAGGSAIVSILESDYMYPFHAQVQQALLRGIERRQEKDVISMNVYHSGPSAVALNLHYDSYNVLVLQLAGQKEWILQDNGQRREWDSISQWRNITMLPGDVLYIPKGVFHAATTQESLDSTTSTHVTIGL